MRPGRVPETCLIGFSVEQLCCLRYRRLAVGKAVSYEVPAAYVELARCRASFPFQRARRSRKLCFQGLRTRYLELGAEIGYQATSPDSQYGDALNFEQRVLRLHDAVDDGPSRRNSGSSGHCHDLPGDRNCRGRCFCDLGGRQDVDELPQPLICACELIEQLAAGLEDAEYAAVERPLLVELVQACDSEP